MFRLKIWKASLVIRFVFYFCVCLPACILGFRVSLSLSSVIVLLSPTSILLKLLISNYLFLINIIILSFLKKNQNTLDEIITTTAYLDLFIRSISEPNLIRIFLQFLCFETYDCNSITATLIKRINAKSKVVFFLFWVNLSNLFFPPHPESFH